MKITSKKQTVEPEFVPFTISIEVESQADANKLFAFFNHTSITDALRVLEFEGKEVSERMRNALECNNSRCAGYGDQGYQPEWIKLSSHFSKRLPIVPVKVAESPRPL